jgi:sulfur carrier protein ThiS
VGVAEGIEVPNRFLQVGLGNDQVVVHRREEFGPDQDALQIFPRQVELVLLERVVDVDVLYLHFEILDRSLERGFLLFDRLGIERGKVLLGLPLALEVDGWQVRAAGNQESDDLAPALAATRERSDLGEDPVGGPRVSVLVAVPGEGVHRIPRQQALPIGARRAVHGGQGLPNHVAIQKGHSGGAVVEDDDVPVPEQYFGDVVLNLDEVELVVVHLVGQEFPDGPVNKEGS